MTITIYWACLEDEWIKAIEPEKIKKRFYSKGITSDDRNSSLAINYCPIFNESIKNTYAIKSIYDYSFKIENNKCISQDYNQQFFDNHVLIRSIEKKFFSFNIRYIFFTDEDSLDMSVNYPVFEENEITKRCITIPGSFNIGKYFRNLEFPFILKKDFNEFIVNNEDVLYYLKFYTKEKIIFKQFKMTNELRDIMHDNRLANTFNKNKKYISIDLWYNKFKGKKYILNKINQNLLE
jgi:hypothetical protein